MTMSLDSLIPKGGEAKNLSFRWGTAKDNRDGTYRVHLDWDEEGNDIPVEDTIVPIRNGSEILCMFWGTKMIVVGERGGNGGGAAQGLEVPIGTIIPWAGTAVAGPGERNLAGKQMWVRCDGRTLFNENYRDLYAVIGNTYGSGTYLGKEDDRWFKVPDLRGRAPFAHAGDSGRSKAFNTVGAWRGGETVKLTVENLPPHTHPQNVSVDFGSGPAKRRDYVVDVPEGKGQVFEQGIGTGSTGGGKEFWIVPPSVTVGGYFIKAFARFW